MTSNNLATPAQDCLAAYVHAYIAEFNTLRSVLVNAGLPASLYGE